MSESQSRKRSFEEAASAPASLPEWKPSAKVGADADPFLLNTSKLFEQLQAEVKIALKTRKLRDAKEREISRKIADLYPLKWTPQSQAPEHCTEVRSTSPPCCRSESATDSRVLLDADSISYGHASPEHCHSIGIHEEDPCRSRGCEAPRERKSSLTTPQLGPVKEVTLNATKSIQSLKNEFFRISEQWTELELTKPAPRDASNESETCTLVTSH